MFKKIILRNVQKKINKLQPSVNINLNLEIPTPCLREIGRKAFLVSRVNEYSQEMEKKGDVFFKEKTNEYKKMISDIISKSNDNWLNEVNQALYKILPYYYAMVREASRRTIKLRHFDVQILGGIFLNENKIAEMVTGEGKTLVATLPACLNALVAKGVHIVTVNDYLAKRDWEWMSPIYRFLGLSCGVIQQDMNKQERQYAYQCDITYGTNNEFGFDYLRDNMATNIEEMVQRGHFYAIIDEVDSILIDEARTPLIISGPTEVSVKKYYEADRVARQLSIRYVISTHDTKEGTVIIKERNGAEKRMERDEFEQIADAWVEEKNNAVIITQRGAEHCESLLGVKSITDETPDQFSNFWVHYIINAIKAHYLFQANKDYIVKDGKVIIVDEFTGRLMPGRRWSDGLHQAVEAKERLQIQQESQTLATITLQNYFRMYDKLAGMTGTAYTEANEFHHIYKLDVVSMPTNRPLIRTAFPDRIYKTKKAKFNAIIEEIIDLYKLKRPVLVGTSSIEDSEQLSFLLDKRGIPHNVLNAKYHEKEAYIVAQAGRLGQVTIATNMAGRGTDIILGGNIDYFIKGLLSAQNINPEDEDYNKEYERLYKRYEEQFNSEHEKVIALGGLHVIGAQRHEARRIDNQLKGRAGRQGDPGSSRFYISLEDDIMRLFGSERIYMIMDRLGFPEDEPIEHPLITRSIEVAQRRVEAYNFEVRKQLLQFDDVMNQQRTIIYNQRREVLEKDDISEIIANMIEEVVEAIAQKYFPEKSDPEGLIELSHILRLRFDIQIEEKSLEESSEKEFFQKLLKIFQETYKNKEESLGSEQLRFLEKMILLSVIDSRWKEHLLVMDALREGISLRAYAQSDPLSDYKREAHMAFSELIDNITNSTIENIFKIKGVPEREIKTVFSNVPRQYKHSQFSVKKPKEEGKQPDNKPVITSTKKVGRNDPCPCGSGKKYKKCCGR